MLVIFWLGTALFLFKRWRIIGMMISLLGISAYFLTFSQNIYLALPVGLLLIATILALIELLVPGFGVFGITSLLIGILALSIGQIDLIIPALEILLTFVPGAILVWVLKQKGYEMVIGHQFVLKTTLNTAGGFISGKSQEHLIDIEGVTQTTLRPSGKVLLHTNEMIDVESDRGLIESGIPVRVTRIKDNIVYVIPLNDIKKET